MNSRWGILLLVRSRFRMRAVDCCLLFRAIYPDIYIALSAEGSLPTLLECFFIHCWRGAVQGLFWASHHLG